MVLVILLWSSQILFIPYSFFFFSFFFFHAINQLCGLSNASRLFSLSPKCGSWDSALDHTSDDFLNSEKLLIYFILFFF